MINIAAYYKVYISIFVFIYIIISPFRVYADFTPDEKMNFENRFLYICPSSQCEATTGEVILFKTPIAAIGIVLAKEYAALAFIAGMSFGMETPLWHCFCRPHVFKDSFRILIEPEPGQYDWILNYVKVTLQICKYLPSASFNFIEMTCNHPVDPGSDLLPNANDPSYIDCNTP